MQRNLVILFALLALVFTGSARADLIQYVNASDDSFKWEIKEKKEIESASPHTQLTVHLTSQTWRGDEWNHALIVIKPAEVENPESAILVISGGRNNADGTPGSPSPTELLVATTIAKKLKTVAAILNQVPNQPILEGRNEDAAIAYTFDQFLQTGESDWPLLLPMVKSAVRAMDAVEAVCKQEFDLGVEQFMLTGGSKRGWTTWLSAAADERVFAIAPVVIDNLNMKPQMAHQLETWGKYSYQIQDYVKLNLPQRINENDPRVMALNRLVDPYEYRDRIKVPKLIVNGTNDPYWVVDAIQYYFDDLPGEKHIHYMANTGHDISMTGVSAIAGFYSMVRAGAARPNVKWEFAEGNPACHIKLSFDAQPKQVRLWQAASPDKDLRDGKWASTPVELNGKNEIDIAVEEPAEGYVACYAELIYSSPSGDNVGFCTEVKVLGKKPAAVTAGADPAGAGK